MKFKDNAFYKAINELKEKNDFKPKKVEFGLETKICSYDYDIGVQLVLAKLFYLNLTYNQDCVCAEFFSNNFVLRNKVYYSPSEVFKILEDREIKDLRRISFVRDYENMYSNETFYFEPEKNEIELFSTYNYKDYEEEEDPYDIY